MYYAWDTLIVIQIQNNIPHSNPQKILLNSVAKPTDSAESEQTKPYD